MDIQSLKNNPYLVWGTVFTAANWFVGEPDLPKKDRAAAGALASLAFYVTQTVIQKFVTTSSFVNVPLGAVVGFGAAYLFLNYRRPNFFIRSREGDQGMKTTCAMQLAEAALYTVGIKVLLAGGSWLWRMTQASVSSVATGAATLVTPNSIIVPVPQAS